MKHEFIMDNLEILIITAIKCIRESSKRPDAENIFRFIIKGSASNLTVEDIEEKLNIMIAQRKLENRETKQGLDYFFLTNYEVERRPCIAVEAACIAIENTDEELVYLENLDSSVDVNISVENPDGESAFASDYLKGQLESYTSH